MVGWFEIPVSDMDRAKTFYETVFKVDIKDVEFDGLKMGWFPEHKGSNQSSGALIKQSSYVPSKEGVLIYFVSKNVQVELDRVEAAGGKIGLEKTKISENNGFMGMFIDTEGNKIALHSDA
ncbi:VOC family protein [Winogradskyella psychrotolerans]|uniref:VOC family protein n=1 Tax=Winogradskyella psychrotolerans TaxID=1344585 RepID=UPI001C06C795|nr:VOC family protein [Winogradskyella psychrotolerans]MBU2929381.1 VOC family protein [Winogradskyella psychrotolerans]